MSLNYLINAYTLKERQNTICKGYTIHDYDKVKDKKYVKNYMEKYNNWNKCFELYFGTCKPFRIEHSLLVYEKYNPASLFDPCCGWGGRLIAASMLNIPYTGMDCNPDLVDCYKNICKDWGGTFTFGDCLTMNWPVADMLFTSPPYFNIEIYVGSEFKTKREWHEWYRQFAEKCKSFKIVCINVNKEIYNIIKTVLGECSEKFLLPIRKRRVYEEFCYTWRG